MAEKEATARVKINKLLEASGWRFFPDGGQPANVRLEVTIPLRSEDLDALGSDFQRTKNGFVDFLLLDRKGFPLVVLEAKAEGKNPLIGKEQARKYARSQNCRFVILSNGNLHYFWDLDRGSPYVITAFPSPESVSGYRQAVAPDWRRLVTEAVGSDYIVLTQRPTYHADASWQNESERADYIRANKLRFLRSYQLSAVHRLQDAVSKGKDRFLFEMATGTGKTLTAAAVIKLFLRTANARRTLFLVDRLELEEQAKKALTGHLTPDFQTVIYKEQRDDWSRAEVVISTVQSLLFNNKYQRLFSPTDFDLVISDEAHRSIGGNARAVFDYFVGYKLGLTATPRDYLRRFDRDSTRDPREVERRLLLDTYRTFGCESGQPTFRYSLMDGVRDGFLINPILVDARTDVTTELLSKEGFVVSVVDDTGENQDEAFKQREFEKRFFSDATNELLCGTFLANALRDPISGEVGKSIVFAVNQNHAAKLVQLFNIMAESRYPGKYHSDFAVQITSSVSEAHQFAANFANNNLLGSENFLTGYKTSRARICVTVGMMTTGYDCSDILNLGLFRPVFSPTDFVQIKGRGTRKHDFREQLVNVTQRRAVGTAVKTAFKLFDFFANCEYFETEFNYDEILKLPRPRGSEGESPARDGSAAPVVSYAYRGKDSLALVRDAEIGTEGMKIDRMLFERFEDTVRENPEIVAAVEARQWDRVIDYINREVFEKPHEFYTLEKLRRAVAVDRRITLREILEKIFGIIPRFKSKEELLEEEFAKFVADYKPTEADAIPAIKHYFKAYLTDGWVRHFIDHRQYAALVTNPVLSMRDFRAVPSKYRALVPEYIKDYVSLNQFAA